MSAGDAAPAALKASLEALWAEGQEPAPRRWLSFPVLLVVCLLLLAARRPEALARPQLWAEDGTVLLRGALVEGPLGAVVASPPYNGYLQVGTRLLAALAAPFPLRWTPAIYEALALLLAAASCAWICRPEHRRLAPDGARAAFAVWLACCPTGEETIGSLANGVWWWLWIVLLLVVSPLPARAGARAAWSTFVALLGLTSPALLALVPALGLRAALSRTRAERLTLLAPVAVVLLHAVVAAGHAEPAGRLPDRLATAAARFVGRVAFEPFVGEADRLDLVTRGKDVVAPVCLLVLAAGAVAAARRPAGRGWLLVVGPTVFIYLLLIAAGRPGTLDLSAHRRAAWGGGRLFILTSGVLVLTLVQGACALRPRLAASLFAAPVAALVVVAVACFRVTPRPDRDWPGRVALVERAIAEGRTGRFELPLDPDGWALEAEVTAGVPRWTSRPSTDRRR